MSSSPHSLWLNSWGRSSSFPLGLRLLSRREKDWPRICEELGFMMLFSGKTMCYDIMTQEERVHRSRKGLFLVSVALKHLVSWRSEKGKQRNTEAMFNKMDQPNDRQGNSPTTLEDESQHKFLGELARGRSQPHLVICNSLRSSPTL